MKISRALGLAVLAGSSLTQAALAADLLVPSQFPTIQAAVDAAVDGDRVLVAPGTYAPFSYMGKTVQVESTGGAGVTTIDGASFAGPAVTAIGTTAGAALSGFTVIAGLGLEQEFDPTDPTLGTITVGGGILAQFANLEVSGCVVQNAFVTGFGGGLYAEQSEISIVESIFRNNQVDDTSNPVPDTNGTGRGAAVLAVGTLLTISQSEFVNNFASRSGGGVYLTGSDAIVSDSVFTGNRADGGSGRGGGAMYVLGSTIDVTASQFVDNLAIRGGAIHFNNNGRGVVRDSLFEGNMTPGSSSRGGAIYALNRQVADPFAEALFINCDFIENIGGGSSGRGGALYSTSSSSLQGNIVVEDSRILRNEATQRGGAGEAGGGFITVRNSQVEDNTAALRGGGFYVASGGGIELDEVELSGSSVLDRGGALYVFRGQADIRNSILANNDSATGGAMDIRSSSSGGSIVNLENVVFENNTSDDLGGAIGISGSTNEVRGDRVSVINNTARLFDSGAIVINSGLLELSNTLIANNDGANFGASAIGMGGNANVTLTNATITGNRNSFALGAFATGGNLTLNNSILWDNDGTDTIDPFIDAIVSHSIVEGGFAGTNVLDVDPQFEDASNGDYSLASGSPAINAGLDSLSSGLTLDLAGNSRFVGIVDMGAYESQDGGPVSCLGDIADDFGFTVADGGGPDGVVDFGDFVALLGLIGPCDGGVPGCLGDIADDFGFTAADGGGPDGVVDFGDFVALLGLIGPCP